MKHLPAIDLLKVLVCTILFAALVFALAGCQSAGQVDGDGKAINASQSGSNVEKIYVYIPCGMREPFDHAVRMFNAAHPNSQVESYYDNAVVLVHKIKDGDRPDVMISPGAVEMKALTDAGIADSATVTDIGTYTIALIAPRGNPAKIKTMEDLAKPSVRTITIGEPIKNSVGFYAKQSLENMGLWEKVKHKVVYPEHALDVVTFAAMKKVDAAIAYKTCPLQSAPEKASKEKLVVLSDVPQSAHPPITVQAGVIKEGKNPQGGLEFVKYLTTEEVQAAFEESGLPRLTNLKSQ